MNTGTAGHAGALAERNGIIGYEEAVCTAFFETEGEITNQFTAGTDATAAEDAAVVVHNDEWVGCIHIVGLPVRLQVPVSHAFVVSTVLQLAVAAADLAVHAEVVAFAEDQGEDELTGIQHLLGFGVDHHPVGGG